MEMKLWRRYPIACGSYYSNAEHAVFLLEKRGMEAISVKEDGAVSVYYEPTAVEQGAATDQNSVRNSL